MSKKKTYDMNLAYLMDCRFMALKCNLDFIATQYERSKVLYPMMERPIYQDFEILVATTIEDAETGDADELSPQSGDGSASNY